MGLSRLSQLLSNTTGKTLYVNPDSIDATDSIENTGNSPTRPFYSLNRAIPEAVRFSYQSGGNNDRFAQCVIVLSPGIHRVTNRPGWIPDGINNFRLRNGTSSSDFSQWDSNTNFDVTTLNNALYKLNSIRGGIFVPRGITIIGEDESKTFIQFDYIPDPENESIERSAIFLLTSESVIKNVTFLDPNFSVYKDYTTTKYSPSFSQHKLNECDLADGINPVTINDGVLSYSTTRTDLQMYYEKIGLAYGLSSGREISPDYPLAIDIQPRTSEYRIIGSKGEEIAISAIRAGDGVFSSVNVTVTLSKAISDIDVDTPIQVQGVPDSGYNGQYIIKQVISPTQLVYEVAAPPLSPAPSLLNSNATLNVQVDVAAFPPLIDTIRSKTIWGRNTLNADGSKVSGFKSVIARNLDGISLQKDPKAFVKYNPTLGIFEDYTTSGNENIQSSSLARYKPSYESYFIKSSNDALVDADSVNATGYANQFISESGSEQVIRSSSSNFGSRALVTKGHKSSALPLDDSGYITHVIPPKELDSTEIPIAYEAIDVTATLAAANSGRLYFANRKLLTTPPETKVEGYKIGARINGTLNVIINSIEYSAKVLIPNGTSSGEKSFTVNRSSIGVNAIASNTITLSQNHTFTNGESVRVISDTAQLPDGLTNDTLYYVITTGSANAIKLAQSLSDALSSNALTLNNKGGELTITSRVSDKVAGEIGHPLQFDAQRGWYITVESGNGIYTALSSVSQANTQKTFFYRKNDNRSLSDTIYRLRYVIPANATDARPPIKGYILQESNTGIGRTDSEVALAFNPNTVTLASQTQLRNQKLIANISWASSVTTVTSEDAHNLVVGSDVQFNNVRSTNNINGTANVGYNGTFTVSSIIDRKRFTVGAALTATPGTFTNNTSTRTTASPYFIRKSYRTTFFIQDVNEIKRHIPGSQDGVYYLTILNATNSPTVVPFTEKEYAQPIENLYPVRNPDNINSDPKESSSYALPEPLGQVVINDPQYSITKETLQRTFFEDGVGIGITNIVSNSSGIAHTIYTAIDHGLNPITTLSITSSGAGYGVGSGSSETYYNAQLLNVVSNGERATAQVTINSAGSISNIRVMDGGSAYSVGDSLSVVGIATTTGHSVGIVSVVSIYNHVNETIKVNKTLDRYSTSYLVSGITSSRSINVSSASTIVTSSITGIGSTSTAGSYVEITGRVIDISTINVASGIATVTTATPHDLFPGNKFLISGNPNSFVVNNVVGLNTFTVALGNNVGIYATFIYKQGSSSQGGTLSPHRENLRGRLVPLYSGNTTTLSGNISEIATTISVNNALTTGLKIGDYLYIDEEIVRISSSVTSDSITVFRGVFGTVKATHISGTLVQKLNPIPIELRKGSIISASGHSFNNNGYGSGNYSASLPERQDRQLSVKEIEIARATKESGGSVLIDVGSDFNNTQDKDVIIQGSLIVEGGSDNGKQTQFNGPVTFNDRVVLNSEKGLEAGTLLLTGSNKTPRSFTIAVSEPSEVATPGSIQYNPNPLSDGYVGWIYTSNNRWEKFGKIGINGADIRNTVGVSSGGSYVGIATLIDFRASGIILSSAYNSTTGITTLTFTGASPLGNSIGISTGSNSFVGLATQINFNGGSNITVSGSAPSGGTGINTITLGISTTAPLTAGGFIKVGVSTNNYLKTGGDDSPITYNDVTNALGYVPLNNASFISTTTSGNSVILDQLETFNGITSTFSLKLNGNPFTPPGSSANLIVSLGGVIQRPGTDYITGFDGLNTDKIQFTTPPSENLNHFIIALGGQGSLLNNASWTGKGNLVVGLSTSNAGILTVGPEGTTLSPDPTHPTGLNWLPRTPTGSVTNEKLAFDGGSLSGYRNAIINGAFDVWQEGNTFVNPVSTGYVADQWQVVWNGAGSTRTISRQSVPLSTTGLPNEGGYFLRFQQTGSGTIATFNNLQQQIEYCSTFAGKQVTFSFWAKSASPITISGFIGQYFGSGGSPSSTLFMLFGSGTNIQTSWTKYSFTFTLPSINGKTIGTDGNDSLLVGLSLPVNTLFTFDLALVQLELGPTATPFENRPVILEHSLCQRYYQTGHVGLDVYEEANGISRITAPFRVPMRAVPSITQSAVDTSGFTTTTHATNITQTEFTAGRTKNGSTGKGSWRNFYTANARLV